MELATEENTLLAFDPINRTVPTTMTRITASMTAYSAMSCPSCSPQSLRTSSIEAPHVADFYSRSSGKALVNVQLGTRAKGSASFYGLYVLLLDVRDSAPSNRVIIPCNIVQRS